MATVIDKLITNKNKTNVYFKLIHAENTVIGFKPPTPSDRVDLIQSTINVVVLKFIVDGECYLKQALAVFTTT